MKKPAPSPKPTAAATVPGTPQVILLAVTGMTPAVLTETLWALAHEQTPVIPHRVVVVTTKLGHARLIRELFEDPAQPGLWQLLRQQILGPAYQNSTLLTLDPIREITAPDPRTGRQEPLEDFRTSAENAAMADFLLEQVRGFTENPEVHLITSIAGGRKTLGALLYACMSLVGRETDRLTHVLVNEPFDSPMLKPRFFFPEQPLQPLTTNDGKVVSAGQARIDLGDIPFVPLRNLFAREIIKAPRSFTGLVERGRQKVNEAASRNVHLTVWRGRRELEVNGVRVSTSAMQQLLLLFLADPANATARSEITKFALAIEPLRTFARKIYAERPPKDLSDWRYDAIISKDFDDQRLRKVLSEFKAKLRDAGSEASALSAALPSKGRFSLDLPESAIKFRD